MAADVAAILLRNKCLRLAWNAHPRMWISERGAMLTPTLISIIVTLIVVGLLLYLIGLIPMDGTIKQIIRVVVIIAVIIWLLQSFGLLGSIGLGHTRVLQ
jgi:hypothetical protein